MKTSLLIAGIVMVLWLVAKWIYAPPATRAGQVMQSPAAAPGSFTNPVVLCPNCGQRNRLNLAEAASRFRCGACRNDLPNLFLVPHENLESITAIRPLELGRQRRNSIVFHDLSGEPEFLPARDLAGLVDAFTGEALNPAQGLYQCARCEVYYHRTSYAVIQSENGGRCVACLSVAVRAVLPDTGQPYTERNTGFEPGVISLDNYRDHIGRVITFKGLVHRVITSRSGNNYALMFENKAWTAGLKAVVLRERIAAVGGPDYLLGLRGRTIRVRGLLQQHPLFGVQIAVSERRMIHV